MVSVETPRRAGGRGSSPSVLHQASSHSLCPVKGVIKPQGPLSVHRPPGHGLWDGAQQFWVTWVGRSFLRLKVIIVRPTTLPESFSVWGRREEHQNKGKRHRKKCNKMQTCTDRQTDRHPPSPGDIGSYIQGRYVHVSTCQACWLFLNLWLLLVFKSQNL